MLDSGAGTCGPQVKTLQIYGNVCGAVVSMPHTGAGGAGDVCKVLLCAGPFVLELELLQVRQLQEQL